jgi:hypothetical protein
VTATEDQLALRPPPWARLALVVFVPVWVWLFLVGARPDGGYPLFAYAIALVALAFITRLGFLSVIGTATGRLTVRNHWSTVTFDRSEIDDVEIDRAERGLSGGWALWLRLSDGTRRRLDVTQVPSRSLSGRRLDRDAEAIRAWVAGRPHPFL